jgi:hypothetical protein
VEVKKMERPSYVSPRAWASLTAGADLASGFPGGGGATPEQHARRDQMLLGLVHCYTAAVADAVAHVLECFQDRGRR